MSWVNALILSFLTINFLTLLLVFYYINRNWEKLIQLTNYIQNIDRQNWRNTEKIWELVHKLNNH